MSWLSRHLAAEFGFIDIQPNGHDFVVVYHSCNALFMLMGWDYVSELQPPTGLLVIPRWYMGMECQGHAMAQAVSRRPLTEEARDRVQVNLCGIYGGQSGTGTGFSQSSSIFACQYITPPSLSTLITSGGWTICLPVAAGQRRSLTPSKSINQWRARIEWYINSGKLKNSGKTLL
jgi:hypothetical protein